MKMFVSKMILALIATALVASSASAATVYEKDGFKYQIKGDWQIQLRQDAGDDQHLDVEYDDLEIKNTISYDLGNNLSAFGQLDFGGKKAADEDAKYMHLEEAYVGLAYQDYSILMGKTTSAADEFGVYSGMEDYGTDEEAFEGHGEESGDDLIKAEASIEMVSIIAAYEVEAENEVSEDTSFYDIFVSAEFAGFELGAAFQNIDDADTIIYGVSIAYDAKIVWVGADYSIADVDGDEYTVWNIAASVPVTEKTTITAGFNMNDSDVDGYEEVSEYYANVQHKLHKNVKVFAEVGNSDEDDSDMGYMAGMQIKF